MNYCTKCVAMGGKWYQFCSMTGRWKFLYVAVLKKEIFQMPWRSIKVWKTGQARRTNALNER